MNHTCLYSPAARRRRPLAGTHCAYTHVNYNLRNVSRLSIYTTYGLWNRYRGVLAHTPSRSTRPGFIFEGFALVSCTVSNVRQKNYWPQICHLRRREVSWSLFPNYNRVGLMRKSQSLFTMQRFHITEPQGITSTMWIIWLDITVYTPQPLGRATAVHSLRRPMHRCECMGRSQRHFCDVVVNLSVCL